MMAQLPGKSKELKVLMHCKRTSYNFHEFGMRKKRKWKGRGNYTFKKSDIPEYWLILKNYVVGELGVIMYGYVWRSIEKE